MSWIYAMYKGEDCLAIGTPKEICEQTGIKLSTFRFYRTTFYKKNRNGKKRRVIIRIDDKKLNEE